MSHVHLTMSGVAKHLNGFSRHDVFLTKTLPPADIL